MNAGTNANAAVFNKWVILFFFAIGGTLHMQAQVRLGFLGGLNSAKVLEKNNIPGWDTATKPFQGTRSGFQLGVILEVPIGHNGLFFQPALTYTSKGSKYNKNNDSVTAIRTDTIYNKQTLDLNYVEIPLNLTYKIPLSANHKNSFFVSAGPYISFVYGGNVKQESLTSSTHKYSSITNPVTVGKGADTYKTLDVGVNGRAGFELGNLMISGYYSQGLTSFYTAPYTGTFHHRVIGASVAIWLSSSSAPQPVKKRDTDKDGVTDDLDLCPLVPGSAANHGCPPDSDHDGIDDLHDSCKNVPGYARYHGCPIPDSDHDGINDEEDKCPHQAGVARYNGCPIPDRDGDGINDEEDKCPDSAGIAANQGCPLVVKEIKKEATEQINYIARNILFATASDQLKDGSDNALTQLAGLLETHPEWLLAIEGYTDNSGNPAKNLQLSQKRADAVKKFLISKGIDGTRLTATGFGQLNPIADNRTPQGKAANRRVELKLSLQKK